MSGYVQTNQVVILPTGAYTVSTADTGKIMLHPGGAAAAITLPTPAVGLHYRFILTAAATGAITVGTGVAGGLRGVALTQNSTVAITSAAVTVGFVNGSLAGDHIDVYCFNSTSWSVSAGSAFAGGIAVV